MNRRVLSPIALMLGLCVGCEPPDAGGAATVEAGHRHLGALEYIVDAQRIRAPGPLRFAGGGEPVAQVGLRFDASGMQSPVAVDAVPIRDGARGQPQPVVITWREGRLGVGRAIITPPADAIELQPHGVEALVVSLYPEVRARLDRPLARELPFEGAGGARKQARGPVGTISREQWGARQPAQLCSDILEPYRMSIHHTASPSDDGPDAAGRMRQMQAFHMDGNGWCDIGYHFVVSQAGDLYEARRDERRPGAHVGGQNAGNVGISLIGNFQEQPLLDGQYARLIEIVRWVSQTHGIPLERGSVKGHQEWPGQNTSCPGDNVLAVFDRILADASGGAMPDPEPGPEPEPVEPGETALTIEWLQGAVDAPGTHPGRVDVPVGESFRVGLRLYNGAGAALRGVRLGYAFDARLEPTHYAIQTDSPARDGETWMLNDADAAPDNPPKDAMGAEGSLTLYAFGEGETKRVIVELRALEPVLDLSSAVRVWVANIDGAHRQDGWRPGVEDRWQAAGSLAIQARGAWLFDGEREPEGWQPCVDGALVGWSPRLDGSLAVSSGCAESPTWTAIDADAWPEMTLWMSAPPGEHRARLVWQGADPDARGAVQWTLFGDGGVSAHVLALSAHPMWTGTVERLTLHFEGAADDELYRIGALYLQSPVDRMTNAPGQTVPRDPPVGWTEADPESPAPDPPAGPGAPGPVPDTASPLDGGPGPGPEAGLDHNAGEVADEGCHAAPGLTPKGWSWVSLIALMLIGWRRRAEGLRPRPTGAAASRDSTLRAPRPSLAGRRDSGRGSSTSFGSARPDSPRR